MLCVMTEIEIRGVPEDVYRRLCARAAETGTTLSDYLLSQLRLLVENTPVEHDQTTIREFVARVRGGELYDLGGAATKIIRRARDAG